MPVYTGAAEFAAATVADSDDGIMEKLSVDTTMMTALQGQHAVVIG